MDFFEVLDQGMEIIKPNAATCVVPALSYMRMLPRTKEN
jgi:hypothetical protein